MTTQKESSEFHLPLNIWDSAQGRQVDCGKRKADLFDPEARAEIHFIRFLFLPGCRNLQKLSENSNVACTKN